MTPLLIALLAASHAGGDGLPRHMQGYEALLDCYVGFMNSKGLTLASKQREVMRWDVAARQRCNAAYAALARQIGSAQTERAWRGLWSENAARD